MEVGQHAGCNASATRPPSSPPIGNRLNRLIMKPQSPSAINNCEPVAWPAKAVAPAATPPTTGPARATTALCAAVAGNFCIWITAPTKGMKSIGLKGSP